MRLSNYQFQRTSIYELVSFERLSVSERASLGDAEHRKNLFGILKPLQSGYNVKVVDCDTALLLLTLTQPGQLPHFALASMRNTSPILRLIADSVLAVRIDGHFLTGADAFSRICPLSSELASSTTTGKLSLRALRLASEIAVPNAAFIADRLYCYNRLPPDPFWVSKLGQARHLLSYRPASTEPSFAELLQANWVPRGID